MCDFSKFFDSEFIQLYIWFITLKARYIFELFKVLQNIHSQAKNPKPTNIRQGKCDAAAFNLKYSRPRKLKVFHLFFPQLTFKTFTIHCPKYFKIQFESDQILFYELKGTDKYISFIRILISICFMDIGKPCSAVSNEKLLKCQV